MERPDQRIAFVHSGGFSHINDGLLGVLRTHFPGAGVDTFDTHELSVWDRHRRPMMALDAFRAYGRKGIRSRAAIGRFGQHTVRFFDAARRELMALTQRKKYDFTIQTQSIVDASQPGIPHFVYTDHSHLTNTAYPSFGPGDFYAADWIDRERGIYRNARAIFTMSNHVTRSLIEHYAIPAARIQLVGIGSNLPIPDLSILEDGRFSSKNILFVGLDWERKGGPQLVQACKEVLKTHPDARLTVIGCAPAIDIPQVEVLGKLPLAEVGAHYRNAAVFCLPTRNEPFGVVFLEAAAYRLPVVATDLGALPDLIDNGVNGYLVAPDDISALAARLTQLLSSPEMCKQFGTAGHDRMLENYTWARAGERIATRIRRELACTGG